MNCQDINQAIVEGSASPLPPEAEEHLRTCARCRELAGTLKVPVPADLPSPTVLREIERGLVADLRPVRPIAPKRYIFVVLSNLRCHLISGCLPYRSVRHRCQDPTSNERNSRSLGDQRGSAGVLARESDGPGKPVSRFLQVGLPLVIVISLMVSVAVLFPFQHERQLLVQRLGVHPTGALMLQPIAAVPLWLVLRRGAILSPIMTGAATGLLAGLVGTTALEIHCPNLDASHILVSHLGVAVLGAVAGLVVGWAVENRKLIRRP
jgi:hypothetical protein